MRRMSIAALASVALVAGAMSAAAQDSGDSVIPSDRAGALDEPERWDCRRIRPEYEAWLDEGNAASDWRYVGKTYRDVGTGELYSWQDWLAWYEDAGCAAALADAGGVDQSRLLIGGAVVAFGTGLIIASGGSGPKSPG